MVDGHYFGHLVEALTDFVVVPYRLRSPLARLAGMNVECTPETTLSVQKMD